MISLNLHPKRIASWLAAIGVHDVVAAIDPCAKLAFGERAELHTTVSQKDLLDAMCAQAVPSILTPWNGGSGFWNKDTGAKEDLDFLKKFSSCAQLTETREMIAAVIDCLGTRPEGKKKVELFSRLDEVKHNHFDRWKRACAVVVDNEFVVNPLLGSGGNDGRCDLGATHAYAWGLMLRRNGMLRERFEQMLFGTPYAGVLSDITCSMLVPESVSAGIDTPTSGMNPALFVMALRGACSIPAPKVWSKRFQSFAWSEPLTRVEIQTVLGAGIIATQHEETKGRFGRMRMHVRSEMEKSDASI